MPRLCPYGGVPLVRHYRRKRTYRTRDRILVHLSSEGLRPEEMTQEGIAQATRSGRSTLTKWLNRLEGGGLLTAERVRVGGHPLPKHAYRLSEEGWRDAAALRDRLASDLVTVRSANLGPLSVRMAEVPRLSSSRLDLTSAISLVRNGRLDLQRIPRIPSRERAAAVWAGGLRQIDRLFGRAEELRALDRWYASSSRVLLVTGLAGIGKSALVAAWIQAGRIKVPVYIFENHSPTTAGALLADFGAFLATVGKPSLATHLSQGVPLDTAFVRRLLARELVRYPLLVVFDNADQLSPDALRLLRGPLGDLLTTAPVKLMIVGRRPPRWLPVLRKMVPSLEILRIQGLDPSASTDLLRHRGFADNPSVLREVVETTRGHPFLLQLAVSGAAGRSTEVHRYLKDEVWATLSRPQRASLETTSVLRKPASERTLSDAAGVDRRVLGSLVDRNLLERTVAGGYLVHDLVREFVRGRMTEDRRRELHARVAGSLLREAEPRDQWEGIYHLLAAGKTEAVASYLDAEGAPLLDSVAAGDISALVRSSALDAADPASSCVFTEILGDGLRIQGHVVPALRQYDHARELALSRGREERIPRLLRKMAFVERTRNRYPKALGYLVEAQARLGRTGVSSEAIEILREMALVEQALGDLNAASRHLNESVDRATETSDRAALARSLLALGSLETVRGHRQLGLHSSLEGLRVAERTGNPTEVSHAEIVVGTGYAEMGELDEALRHVDRGVRLARLLGNLRLIAYGTMNRAAILTDLRRYREAGPALHEAEGYLDTLEERDTLALLRISAGQREMGLGRWSRAERIWGESLSELRTLGSPLDLARALKSVAGYRLEHGEVDRAKATLNEARVVARDLGNPSLLSEIEASLQNLENSKAPRLPS